MNNSDKSAGGGVLLTKAQRQTLDAVLNLIIAPSDDGRMPGAAEYDVWGYVREAAGTLAPAIRDELERLDTHARAQHDQTFAALDEAERLTLVEHTRAAEPGFMNTLVNQTVAYYYQQDRVLAAIGMEARPPFPLGYQVEAGDLSLLDPVRDRGRIYREVVCAANGSALEQARTMSRPVRVIYDLDDTLYPERSFALSGFRAAGAWATQEWGIDDIADELVRLLDNGHLGAVFKIALERFRPQHSDEDLARFIDVYRRHEPDLKLFDDAVAALERSQECGPIGLITDGTHWVQRNKVQALGIADRFDTIIYTGALGGRDFHKPHPRAFEMMEDALAAPGALFVYIGDNPAKDFVSPNARGWASVQVVRDGAIHDAHAVADGGAPQHTIDSLAELGPVLDALGQRS